MIKVPTPRLTENIDLTLLLNAFKNLAAAAGAPIALDDKLAIDEELASKIKEQEQFRDLITEYKNSLDEYIEYLENWLNTTTLHDDEWYAKKVQCYDMAVERFKVVQQVFSSELFIQRFKGRQTVADRYTKTIDDKVIVELPTLVKQAETILQSNIAVPDKQKAQLVGLLQRCYNGFDNNNQQRNQTFNDLLTLMNEITQNKSVKSASEEPKFSVQL